MIGWHEESLRDTLELGGGWQPVSPPLGVVCKQGGIPPICRGGTAVWDETRCAWVCRTYEDSDNGGDTGGGDSKKTPLDRVADLIDRILAGGGGGITIPQIPHPQAVVAPTTERRYNPAAILLLVAGLALGGYYVYQKTRRS